VFISWNQNPTEIPTHTRTRAYKRDPGASWCFTAGSQPGEPKRSAARLGSVSGEHARRQIEECSSFRDPQSGSRGSRRFAGSARDSVFYFPAVGASCCWRDALAMDSRIK